MQLTVLGCSAAYPGPGGACSGYLIREGKTTLLVDCGTGVLSNIQHVITLEQVDGIVVSHFHADHFFDLIPYRYRLMHLGHENAGPAIYLPPGGKKALLKTVSAFNKSADFFSKYFHVEEYDPSSEITVGKLKVEFAPVKHYVPTYAVSVSGKKKLVYSADSGLCDELTDIAQGADLFLCEATRYTDGDGEWGHLHAIDAVELAQNAGVKSLILTHFWPDHDYSKELELAKRSFGKRMEGAGILSTYVI